MRRIKVEDVFKVDKEIVKGINPVTKEHIEFEKVSFNMDGIEFSDSPSFVEGILNMDLLDEEYEYVRQFLTDYVSFADELDEYYEDETMIENVLGMEKSIAVRTYLINAMADILFTYLTSDMTEEEVRPFINNDTEYDIYRKLCEII